MPDPISNGCNAMPPITVSANPPANSQEEILIYGCAPKAVRSPVLTETQARSEIFKQCSNLKLSAATTKSLIASLKLGADSSSPAGPPVQQALQMLKTLGRAVKQNPKLSVKERNQFVGLWTKLEKRGGARKAWVSLGQEKLFWGRMSAKNRWTAAWGLANHRLTPAMTAKGIVRVIKHHLFASANQVGRHNALADPCDSCKLLNANTLPDGATQKNQAAALMNTHLGHMKPASRAILHQQVLAKANYLRKAFFEFKPGSTSKKLWGDRIVNAHGRDWYKQCLSMMMVNSARNACRSAFKGVGAHKGADVVCGKD